MNTPNYYAIIPAQIRYDKKLSSSEKLLYAEITALSNKNGYCWSSNEYFAKLYGKNKTTISRWVSRIKEAGYIRTELVYEGKEIVGRKIFLMELKSNTPIDENAKTPIDKNAKTPIDENAKYNSTSYNTTSINNIEYTDIGFNDLIWSIYKTINKSGKSEGLGKAIRLKAKDKILLYESVKTYKDYKPFETYKHCSLTVFINKKRYLDDWTNETEATEVIGTGLKVLE